MIDISYKLTYANKSGIQKKSNTMSDHDYNIVLSFVMCFLVYPFFVINFSALAGLYFI